MSINLKSFWLSYTRAQLWSFSGTWFVLGESDIKAQLAMELSNKEFCGLAQVRQILVCTRRVVRDTQ